MPVREPWRVNCWATMRRSLRRVIRPGDDRGSDQFAASFWGQRGVEVGNVRNEGLRWIE